MENILEIKNLTTEISTPLGDFKAVDNISFSLKKGETLGIVGESGCGKSITSLSIMGLLQKGVGKITSGEILFDGYNLLAKNENEMQKIRGKEIAMIFQEPSLSLNPVLKVGYQIEEVLKLHLSMSKKQSKIKTFELLESMGIKDVKRVYENYPFQLSGGMCQRVMIAMSMACNPKVLIADEPTTALDVTLQAQILDLISNLKNDFNTSIILISHNLGVIANTCDNVIVMYRGQILESSTVTSLFDSPKHPYTKALFDCIPTLDVANENKKLVGIKSTVPPITEKIIGCSFARRCNFVIDECLKKEIPMKNDGENHFYRCIF